MLECGQRSRCQLRCIEAEPGAKLGVHHRGQRRAYPGRVRPAQRGDFGADNRPFRVLGNPRRVTWTQPVQGGQEQPLVIMRFQRREVEERRQAVPAASALQWRGDEVPEAAFGQHVLVREQPVVGALVHRAA